MIRRLIYWVSPTFRLYGRPCPIPGDSPSRGLGPDSPQAQKDGFWFQQSVLANMDDDAAMEEVMLFGRDNGHYPTFDLFKFYYVIVDNYTKEIQYISDEIYVTDKYALTVEDRNNDGISELYIDYFKDGKFTVDERGYNLRTTRCYDRIEWSPESEKFNPQQP